jgi:hypothetical protein
VIDQAAFHEVDEVPLHAGSQNVSAHDEHAGRAGLSSGAQALGENRQGWMREFVRGVERQKVGEREVVLALAERLEAEAGTIELGEGHEATWDACPRLEAVAVGFIQWRP